MLKKFSEENVNENFFYNYNIDAWSTGMVLYKMIFGRLPYKLDNLKNLTE